MCNIKKAHTTCRVKLCTQPINRIFNNLIGYEHITQDLYYTAYSETQPATSKYKIFIKNLQLKIYHPPILKLLK